MELAVLERVLLLNVLPPSGDILTLRIVRKLREELSFSEEEIAEFELTHNEGFVQWNVEKAKLKNVEIGPKAKALIAGELDRRNKEKTLTEQFLDLYEKFVEEDA